MRESWVRYLAWILVVSFPVSMVMADATSAMLIANGSATVNGSPIERATAVFPGDHVQTGPNTVATLTSQGSAVTVGGNSSLVFSKSFVNVLCGTALISTSHGMAARVSNLLVQPTRGTQARFEISQNEGRLQIIAREGTLAIDNGATTTSLQPGRMLTANATCMAAPYADDQTGSATGDNPPDNGQSTSKKKGAPGPPGPPAPTTGGTSTGTLVVAAAGTMVVAGVVVCVTTQLCTGSSAPPPPPPPTCASPPCPTTPGTTLVPSR